MRGDGVFGSQGVSVQTKGDLVAAADIAYEIVTASGQYPDQSGGFTPFWPQELIEHFQMPAKEMDAGVYDLMVRAHIRAEEYVNYYKPVILQVASELLAHGSLYGSHIRDLVEDHEVRMQMAKDEELANAEARAAEEEERLRKEREFEEAEAARRAEAEAEAERIRAEAAAQVEAEGVAGAIDVESSEAPLSGDPFGTAAESEREAEGERRSGRRRPRRNTAASSAARSEPLDSAATLSWSTRRCRKKRNRRKRRRRRSRFRARQPRTPPPSRRRAATLSGRLRGL